MNRDSTTIGLSTVTAVSLVILGGLFLAPASAQAQWQISGTSIYYNGGKVGVGTTNPKRALEVVGGLMLSGSEADDVSKNTTLESLHYDLSQKPILYWWGISSSTDTLMRIGSNNTTFNAPTKIEFYTAPSTTATGSKQMVIVPSGNIGMGANNPSEKLEIAGNVKLSGDVLSSDSEIQLKNTGTGSVVKLLANGDVCIGSGCP